MQLLSLILRGCSYLRDKVALQPRFRRELPAFGARHLPFGHVFREVRDVGWILKQFAVAEADAVYPGDGEVEISLTRQVAQEEGGGQKLRVGFAVVRVGDSGVKHVAHQVHRDREGGKPAADDHESVVASVPAGAGQNLGVIIHVLAARGGRRLCDHCAEGAQLNGPATRNGRGKL